MAALITALLLLSSTFDKNRGIEITNESENMYRILAIKTTFPTKADNHKEMTSKL